MFLQDDSPALYQQHGLNQHQHPATAHNGVRPDNTPDDLPPPANINEMNQHQNQFPQNMGNDMNNLAEDFHNMRMDRNQQQREQHVTFLTHGLGES